MRGWMAVCAATVLCAVAAGGQTGSMRQAVSFTCIEHRQVSEGKPGRCSICGLDLLPAEKVGTCPPVGERFRVRSGTAVVKEADITRVVKTSTAAGSGSTHSTTRTCTFCGPRKNWMRW